MLAAVFTVWNAALVPIGIVEEPTKVWFVPAAKVTAPAEDPRLIIVQSNPVCAGKLAITPASVSVPVGNVSVTAVAEVVVIINVNSWATVRVAEALIAETTGWDL